MTSLARKFVYAYLVWTLAALAAFVHADEKLTPVTVEIPMRDGTRLPTDLYTPSSKTKDLPCILIRSPNGRAGHADEFAPLAKQGYVVAIQDTRSVLDVEGKTVPYLTDGWGDLQDGYDTVQWLAESDYTNGKIGTAGVSALGITQLLMAPTAPPNLICQHVGMAASSLYHDAIFIGGQFHKSQVEGWLGAYAPDPVVLQFVTQMSQYNAFWRNFDSVDVAHQVDVPGLHMGGWYDIFLQGTLDSFASRQAQGAEGAKGEQKLVIGPWTHYWPHVVTLGDFEVPAKGREMPHDTSKQRWFAYHLKGEKNGISELPSVTYYVMGPFDGSPSSGNVWRTASQWPVPAQAVPFYLKDGGRLEASKPPLQPAKKQYAYDPANPVPTIGGRNLFLPAGPKDQKLLEAREDVVLFTTEPLKDDLEITGRMIAKLFVSTDCEDTDIVVRLTDVYPDGRSILVADGICRLAGSEGPFAIAGATKDPVEVGVDLWSTSLVFAKGHSIRISVSSSNYPRFEINPNRKVGDIGAPIIAHNAVHMGPQYPSRLILPVVRQGDVWIEPVKELSEDDKILLHPRPLAPQEVR